MEPGYLWGKKFESIYIKGVFQRDIAQRSIERLILITLIKS